MKQNFEKTNELITLGKNIKILRSISGKSGARFAETIGISRTNLYYLEIGGAKNIAIDTIHKLCAQGGITPSELFNERLIPLATGEKTIKNKGANNG